MKIFSYVPHGINARATSRAALECILVELAQLTPAHVWPERRVKTLNIVQSSHANPLMEMLMGFFGSRACCRRDDCGNLNTSAQAYAIELSTRKCPANEDDEETRAEQEQCCRFRNGGSN